MKINKIDRLLTEEINKGGTFQLKGGVMKVIKTKPTMNIKDLDKAKLEFFIKLSEYCSWELEHETEHRLERRNEFWNWIKNILSQNNQETVKEIELIDIKLIDENDDYGKGWHDACLEYDLKLSDLVNQLRQSQRENLSIKTKGEKE